MASPVTCLSQMRSCPSRSEAKATVRPSGETAGEEADRHGHVGDDTQAPLHLVLIDEVHTPDSSRWWVADTFEERVERGDEPESLDKEVVRRALAAAGYTGTGPIPELPDDVWTATTERYIDAYERLTGTTFVRGVYPAEPRILAAVAGLEHH